MRLSLIGLFTVTAVIASTPAKLEVPLHFEREPSGSFATRGGLSATIEPDGLRTGPLRLRFVGGSPAVLEPSGPTGGRSHYYFGRDPKSWRPGVSHYSCVRARGVYPGIDAVYYSQGRSLEYDLEIAPGADPRQVLLQFEGASRIRSNEAGDLILLSERGESVQRAPLVYQEGARGRERIEARYRITGEGVRIDVGRYDQQRKLVIDPVLVYATFLGGNGSSQVDSVAVDATGSIYATGLTTATDFPVRAPGVPGSGGCFLTKFAPDGRSLIYSTFFGQDRCARVAVTPDGNAFVTGRTARDDLPLLNPSQPQRSGLFDAFVARFDPSGNLVYSTYFGGPGDDYGQIAVDASGSVYMGGSCGSGCPGTASTSSTGYLAKFSPAGSRMFLRIVPHPAWDIAIDATGIYTTGWGNPAWAVTAAFPSCGLICTFVAKWSLDGSTMIYSSLLGGSQFTGAAGIAVDGLGNAYLAGATSSYDFPLVQPLTSPPPFDFFRRFSYAFLTKINPAGSQLVYSTLLGPGSLVSSLAVDPAGNAAVVGRASDQPIPLYSALFSELTSNRMSFLARINATGSAFSYSTYLPGIESLGVAVHPSGDIVVGGRAIGEGPVLLGATTDAFDGTRNQTPESYAGDGYIARLATGPPPVAITLRTNPAGRKLTIDGFEYTAPVTQYWMPGSNHTLVAKMHPDGANVWGFSSWSQGGSATQTITAPNNATTYTATFATVPCPYGAPATMNFPVEGGTRVLDLDTGFGCAGSLLPGSNWLAARQLQTPLQFAVTAGSNSGPPRTGTFTIGSETIQVTQAGSAGTLPAPTITAPTGSLGPSTRSFVFSWTPVPGATGYEVRAIDAFPPPSGTLDTPLLFWTTLSGNAATSTTLTGLGGAITLRVRACNGAFSDTACGTWAASPSLIVLPSTPGSPQITFPAEGATLQNSTNEFKWTAGTGAQRYRLIITGPLGAETQIEVPDLSTIYTLRGGSGQYTMSLAACSEACGTPVIRNFNLTVPPPPSSSPVVTGSTPLSGNTYRFTWNPVSGADLYRILVVQPSSGPGGGALTVASRQVSAPEAVLAVPAGRASVVVQACNSQGCAPHGAATAIDAPGPNPPAPVLGQPISVVHVDGPEVIFSWSRIPGDNGSNTTYRIYVGDLMGGQPVLDALTTNNYYGAKFEGGGRRFDALVIANPGPNQIQGPTVGFIAVRTPLATPAPSGPTYGSSFKEGDIDLIWSPLNSRVSYQWALYRSGSGPPVAAGITVATTARVRVQAVNGNPTGHSLIVRACTQRAVSCQPDSDAGWGPWSNAPGGSGVGSFTVVR